MQFAPLFGHIHKYNCVKKKKCKNHDIFLHLFLTKKHKQLTTTKMWLSLNLWLGQMLWLEFDYPDVCKII